MMREVDLESIVAPLSFAYDGAKVSILEVTKSKLVTGVTWYFVHMQVEYRGKKSRRFTLMARSWRELLKKLLVEIPKFKLAVLMGYEI